MIFQRCSGENYEMTNKSQYEANQKHLLQSITGGVVMFVIFCNPLFSRITWESKSRTVRTISPVPFYDGEKLPVPLEYMRDFLEPLEPLSLSFQLQQEIQTQIMFFKLKIK